MNMVQVARMKQSDCLPIGCQIHRAHLDFGISLVGSLKIRDIPLRSQGILNLKIGLVPSMSQLPFDLKFLFTGFMAAF